MTSGLAAQKTVSVILCLSMAMSPFSVRADPCGMVPPISLTAGSPELIRVGDQLTYVFFSEGIEDIVLRPGFKGLVSDFGMLIPFPDPPELRKVPDEIFSHIQKAIDPPEVVIDLRARFVFAARSPKVGALAERADDLHFGGVNVIREEAVGMYQAAVLEASNPLALKSWMEAHGYVYPAGMDDVCGEYIDSGWVFVAVKANIGNRRAVEARPGMRQADPSLPEGASFEGAVQAMGFRFRCDAPVIPMRLSAFNEGKLHNIVYILSDTPCRITELDTLFVKRQLRGLELLRNIREPLPVRVLGGTLEDAERAGVLRHPRFDRNPTPHNGHALELFANDLLAVHQNRLVHPFEEREKELLRIGERLGLRGPEVDARIQETLAAERAPRRDEVLAHLSRFTLSVVEGDFPREVIARDNLTLQPYRLPEHGSTPPRARDGRVAAAVGPPGSSTALGWFLGGVVGALVASFVGRTRRLLSALLALAFVVSLSPAVAQAADREVERWLAGLGETERAVESAAKLIALGSAALPGLVQEVTEGQDLCRRGWAIVCLADIGDRSGIAPLRRITEDPRASGLVQMWCRAALTRLRGVDGVRELLLEQIRDPSRQTAVAEVLLGMRGSAVRPLATLLLGGESNAIRQLSAAYLGSLDSRVGGGLVRRVMEQKLRHTPEQAARGLPWEGNALFLPRYQWSPLEAWRVTIDLICWLAWCEENRRPDAARQIQNNLRDLSWRTGLGFSQGGGAVDWTRRLLAAVGRDPQSVSEDTDARTTILILDLLRTQVPENPRGR